LLGIGSGINCVMIALHWQKSLVLGNEHSGAGLTKRPTVAAEAT